MNKVQLLKLIIIKIMKFIQNVSFFIDLIEIQVFSCNFKFIVKKFNAIV